MHCFGRVTIDIINDHPNFLTNLRGKMVMSNEKPPIDLVMQEIPEPWRYRWCKADGPCACMGAANCSGGLSRQGYSMEEWDGWVGVNPDPNPPKGIDRVELLRVLKSIHGIASEITVEDPPEIRVTDQPI